MFPECSGAEDDAAIEKERGERALLNPHKERHETLRKLLRAGGGGEGGGWGGGSGAAAAIGSGSRSGSGSGAVQADFLGYTALPDSERFIPSVSYRAKQALALRNVLSGGFYMSTQRRKLVQGGCTSRWVN
jgi:hypothetical protein